MLTTLAFSRSGFLAPLGHLCYRDPMRWTPEELADQARGRLLQRGSRGIAGAFLDSRQPVPGGLFVPIVAARDGHDFIPAAVEGGAAAVLLGPGHACPTGDITVVAVDETLSALTRLAAARRSGFPGPVVSVSGSNGKTTTRALLSAALEPAFAPVLSTRGNFNNHLGVPLTLLGEPHEPRGMVLELGMSAPGENDHLAAIVRPTVHVVTSIALEHLEFMKTIEAIAAAEAEPLAHVDPRGLVVLPSDEPLLQPHRPRAPGPTLWTVGPDEDAEVRIVEVRLTERTEVVLRVRGGAPFSLSLRVFGTHNARNAAAAVAVGHWLGLPQAELVAALEAVEPVGDRGRLLGWGPHRIVADCYNANPGSVAAALRSLAAVDVRGPRVAVLGDMLELGPDELSLHAEVGALAGALGIDDVLGVGPRSRATVEAAGEQGVASTAFDRDAIAEVVAAVQRRFEGAEPGVVLVKGSRGMQLERVITGLAATGC